MELPWLPITSAIGFWPSSVCMQFLGSEIVEYEQCTVQLEVRKVKRNIKA